jgi:hypothetical protein
MIIHHATVITFDQNNRIIENGAVHYRHGRRQRVRARRLP